MGVIESEFRTYPLELLAGANDLNVLYFTHSLTHCSFVCLFVCCLCSFHSLSISMSLSSAPVVSAIACLVLQFFSG